MITNSSINPSPFQSNFSKIEPFKLENTKPFFYIVDSKQEQKEEKKHNQYNIHNQENLYVSSTSFCPQYPIDYNYLLNNKSKKKEKPEKPKNNKKNNKKLDSSLVSSIYDIKNFNLLNKEKEKKLKENNLLANNGSIKKFHSDNFNGVNTNTNNRKIVNEENLLNEVNGSEVKSWRRSHKITSVSTALSSVNTSNDSIRKVSIEENKKSPSLFCTGDKNGVKPSKFKSGTTTIVDLTNEIVSGIDVNNCLSNPLNKRIKSDKHKEVLKEIFLDKNNGLCNYAIFKKSITPHIKLSIDYRNNRPSINVIFYLNLEYKSL